MSLTFLDFEKPIEELEQKIAELQRISRTGDLSLENEIRRLQHRSIEQTRDIFSKLGAWQITQIARHPERPYTLDYVERIVDDFQEIHGDRMFSDDPAIVAGLGFIDSFRVAVIGHQKGRDTQERTFRNFGMPRPEGYRKAQRVMKLAERFGLPIITLIDTPGAYPGVGAEERGQSHAIASAIELMTRITSPVVSVVIGEGGSGGALAIGVCDRLIMLQYSTYSVISPEGCASILWKSSDKAHQAAEAMGMTSSDLLRLELVDEIVSEPLGGAHRDYDGIAGAVKLSLVRALESLSPYPADELLERRYRRLMAFGAHKMRKKKQAD
ncbi:MAG: acetyl-CoA carboxylase carboxyltransferase subunit alpha [Gammaproteobacteria bacterium]|nr:acetyl-CoA carboxylase carboxyltransferase subunit alpha [Gammaproteobacteria bacterium]MYJ51747.1 acetyl-CoA carboxylase carboxyltransferase subunit alpha [Gammaproteobacteria bacterium]